MLKKEKWGLNGEINTMWDEMANNIKKVAIEILEESKKKGSSSNET